MDIMIEKKGLQTLLNMLLSCKCPVTGETEKALFEQYHRVKTQDLIDFSEMLRVTDINPQPTPLHLVAEFCSYSQDNPQKFTITHNDIIRYSCTGQHFYHFLTAVDPLVVKDTANFMLAHMLVPATLRGNGEDIEAVYNVRDHQVRFLNILLPPDIPRQDDAVYGVHLGTALTLLDDDQMLMVNRHLDNIRGFSLIAKEVQAIDYRDFQRYGNYQEQVRQRILKNFPS